MIFKTTATAPSVDLRRFAPAPWERGVHFHPEPDPDKPDPTKPPPKTYDDAAVNAMIAKEKRAAEAAAKAAEATLRAEYDAKLAEMQSAIELAGKSADEKARIQAQQAAKKIEDAAAAQAKQLAETTAQLEAERNTHKATRLSHLATSALSSAKAFAGGLEDAIPSFLSRVEIDFDPEKPSTVTGVRYGGLAHKTLDDAARAFLKDKPHFAAAAAGGAGTRPSNGGPPAGKTFADMTAAELMQAGLGTPVRAPVHSIAAPGDDTPAGD